MDAKTSIRTYIKPAIFKKTPYAADSKPGGRDVAKDMFEVGVMPLPMKTLPGHGCSRGDRLTVAGGTVTHPGGAYEKQCYADI